MTDLPVNVDVSVFRLKRVVELVAHHIAASAVQPLQPHLLPLRLRVDGAARRPGVKVALGQFHFCSYLMNELMIKLMIRFI